MAHAVLFATSCAMLVAHVLFALPHHHHGWRRALYTAGPLASMWNHGGTSAAAKWADRALMAAGFCLDLLVAPTTNALLLELAAIAAYAAAKRAAAGARPLARLSLRQSWQHARPWPTLLHAAAHALVTAAHCMPAGAASAGIRV